MIKRYFIISLALFLHLLVAGLPGLRTSATPLSFNQAEPARLRIAGLRGSVTIRRDERGIPYIEAGDEHDLFFAQGYATASDRLWQMDLLRRTGRGELSEIFGRDVLEEDKHYRTYGFAPITESVLANASPRFRASLEAYARGVNAFIDSLEDKSLPPEFQVLRYKPRPWKPSDSLVIGKTFSVALSSSWETDLMRSALARLPQDRRNELLPETSPLDVVIVGSDKAKKKTAAHTRPKAHHQGEEAKLGPLVTLSSASEIARRSLVRVGLFAEDRAMSNNWVVSGKRTASGQPMLANDPHLAPSVPAIWYMTHLATPDLRVAGVAIPGVPGIIIGHNDKIAWGVTNLPADVQDLYVEHFDKENARRYKTPEGWSEAEVRREAIKVRKNFSDSATENVDFEVTVTRHGPIIHEQDGRRYALRWTSLTSKTVQFEAFYLINSARNWDEFRDALKKYIEPAQNFVYADVNGHIGYYGAGEIPVRKTGDGSLPYDGSTGEGEWVGVIPFAQLPQAYDPPSAIIVTANNRVVGEDYPYVITREWAQPYRARRIFNLLQSKQKLTINDFRAIQSDTYSFGGAIFAKEAARVLLETARKENDVKLIETLRSFEQWEGFVNVGSSEPVLLLEMRNAFRRHILAGVLGDEGLSQYFWANSDTLLDRIVTERPREWLPKEFKDYAELFRACYQQARDTLTKRDGPDESKWKWGLTANTQVHFSHPLAAAPLIGQRFDITPFPQVGSASSLTTVNVGPRVSMRLIADASNWDNTQQGIPLGQSGSPASPHWKDQLDDWRAVTPRTFPFSKKAVAEATRQTIVLAPLTQQ